ncbi:MAG: glucose-6-phosphate isomerase [Eubacteriales bacterium]|nr:glucose-6-phosphate isomerase [Eubacteriales bacterium]MDD4390812.1 glucose-6-phosphate isomerase [Eubacteriales bacterium]
MDLRIDLLKTGIPEDEIKGLRSEALAAYGDLKSGKLEFSGWVNLPESYDKKEFEDIIAIADEIKKKCEALIVIGIGGSYLGARAVIEALAYNADPSGVEVRFAGNNMSAVYHEELLDWASKRDICVCVVSKSGTTTEPAMAFALFKDMLIKKYGIEEARSRIYAVTDACKGVMREEVDKEGYKSFVVPDDTGGRYSVLTPVGLLPIAAAGIDIRSLMEGALSACKSYGQNASLTDYAVCRYLLSQSKQIEIFEYYEPSLQYFAEWLKQLFGESEGKEGKGLFPASLSFSADLHSMGQFLQEGNQIFFENVIDVLNPPTDLILPDSAGSLLAGRSINAVNRAALNGVIAAHRSVGIPIVKVEIPELTPYFFGQMIYFFEMTCAITGLLMGVDPFNQPGVEGYKSEMKKELMK